VLDGMRRRDYCVRRKGTGDCGLRINGMEGLWCETEWDVGTVL
jgi:hypothetical protein